MSNFQGDVSQTELEKRRAGWAARIAKAWNDLELRTLVDPVRDERVLLHKSGLWVRIPSNVIATLQIDDDLGVALLLIETIISALRARQVGEHWLQLNEHRNGVVLLRVTS